MGRAIFNPTILDYKTAPVPEDQLRKVVGNMRDMAAGKLAQTWEGPYRVTAIAGAGAYYLEDLDERPLPRPWNANNLKKFYA